MITSQVMELRLRSSSFLMKRSRRDYLRAERHCRIKLHMYLINYILNPLSPEIKCFKLIMSTTTQFLTQRTRLFKLFMILNLAKIKLFSTRLQAWMMTWAGTWLRLTIFQREVTLLMQQGKILALESISKDKWFIKIISARFKH